MSDGGVYFRLKRLATISISENVVVARYCRLAIDLQSGVSSNCGRSWFRCIKFFDGEVCIDFSNTFVVDLPSYWIDVVNGHGLFCGLNKDDLLHPIAQCDGTHQMRTVCTARCASENLARYRMVRYVQVLGGWDTQGCSGIGCLG